MTVGVGWVDDMIKALIGPRGPWRLVNTDWFNLFFARISNLWGNPEAYRLAPSSCRRSTYYLFQYIMNPMHPHTPPP